MSVLDINIDWEQLEYGNPKKRTDGNYFITTQIKECEENPSKPLYFQFNKTVIEKDLEQTTKSFDLRMSDSDINGFIQDAEEMVLNAAKENKESWFPSAEITDGYLDTAFMSSIKQIKKSHDIYVKVRVSNNMKVFDSQKNEISIEELKEKENLGLIVNMAGIWFTKTRFGITWMVEQIKVPKSKKIKEFMFEEEEEEAELDNVFPDE